MKGFRQSKEPSKAEMKKAIQHLNRVVAGLEAQVDLYKRIAMRMRNCKDLKELEELRKAMQEAKEAVIFAERTPEGKLIDPKTGEELQTDQEYDENAEETNQATEEVHDGRISLMDEITRMKKENPNITLDDLESGETKFSYEFLEQEYNKACDMIKEITNFEIMGKKVIDRKTEAEQKEREENQN